ncbi:response regulator transcription factor [Roseibium denhamense]|uniref:DNA-binding response regulator, OmpR family, contains REC and winged-helix (WHTH) domain n=1 Tax=Roseibium denhamense TaxID=76305 RepID=A0ABY1PGU2_9HYPH|nr:response regulator transcription factor [Roseibium denhamense]MTI06216.1 response regulator transcription factor [Roseibium denhamense]SMP32633.1 DNA-binding response regulator, OmpR family, contains REC and winged-helix (wHTH) domain [Roseibium denhamense]
MFIIVDSREIVTAGYASAFEREGYASLELQPSELTDWLEITCSSDLASVDAILLGDTQDKAGFVSSIRSRCPEAQIVALEDTANLETTLSLFSAGLDDVLKKPVHVREIIARVGVFRRRIAARNNSVGTGAIEVFFDGRDPVVGGDVMELPRRERRILEYLVKNKGRRVTKTQIFNAVYGVMNDGVDECVVESHISKLRKKLKKKLGFDAIESTRYIGYMLKDNASSKQKVGDTRRPVQASQTVSHALESAGDSKQVKAPVLSVVGA